MSDNTAWQDRVKDSPSQKVYAGEGRSRPKRSAEMKRRASTRLSKADTEALEQMVEALMINGVSDERQLVAVRDRFPTVTKAKLIRLHSKLRAGWMEQDKQARPHNKYTAQRRIYGHIAKAQKDGAHGSVASLERLLSDIQGTRDPVEVNLNVDATVSESIMHVVANLSTSEMDAMVREQARLKAGGTPSNLLPHEAGIMAAATAAVPGDRGGAALISEDAQEGRGAISAKNFSPMSEREDTTSEPESEPTPKAVPLSKLTPEQRAAVREALRGSLPSE